MKKAVFEIIAEALSNLEVKVVTHVPGSGGTRVYDAWLKMTGRRDPVSFHEEVAYTVAHGAALSGERSAVLIKSHGLAKAANSLIDSLSGGTTAGFVIFVFNDKTGLHSDNIFDALSFIKGTKIPFHIGSVSGIYNDVIQCYERSESIQLPVVLFLEGSDLEEKAVETRLSITLNDKPEYSRNIRQHLVVPIFAEYQHKLLEARLAGEDTGTIPLPPVPVIPDGLPKEWQPVVTSYKKVFDSFRMVRGDMVCGDTGVSTLFALPPFDCVDMTTYMGGSLPLAIGAYMAGKKNVWAVTGDFSFIAAGHLALVEAIQRKIPLKVLIFYNKLAATTGGQEFPDGLLQRILDSYKEYVKWIEPGTEGCNIDSILFEAFLAEEIRIVVADFRESGK
jgi:TPP-dependent indolepyruvate ferredoxin oxidoreductase alpha subunit